MTNKNRDIRTINGQLKVRDATTTDDGSHVISGYAVVFNQPSEDLGGFIEYVNPQAFDGVDLSDVILLFNHDFNNTLARVSANSLTINIDDTGLAFQATLPNTTLGNDTFENIQNGNYQGCSFGFTIAADDWDWDENDNATHTINKIDQLYEISITPLPAYTETSVNIERSLEKLAEEKQEVEEKPVVKKDKPVKDNEIRSNDDDTDTAKTFKVGNPVIVNADHMENMKGSHGIISGVNGSAYEINYFPTDGSAEVLNHKWVTGDEIEPDTSAEKVTVVDGKDVLGSGAQDPGNNDNDDSESSDDEQDSDDSGMDDNDRDDDNPDIQEDGLDKHIEKETREKMAKDITPKVNIAELEKRNMLTYLKTGKAEKRDVTGGIGLTGGAVLIPNVIMPAEHDEHQFPRLGNLVRQVSVTATTGKLPIFKTSSNKLAKHADFAETAKSTAREILPITWDLESYTGAYAYSLELLQDSTYDWESELQDELKELQDNTDDDLIITALTNKITATSVASTVDGKDLVSTIKNVLNVKLLPVDSANASIVLSQSAFNTLDVATDSQGRALIQPDLTQTSNYTLLGKKLIVVDDTLFPNAKAGDINIVIAPLEKAVIKFNQSQVQGKFQDNYESFYSILGLFYRLDVEQARPEVINYISSTSAGSGE